MEASPGSGSLRILQAYWEGPAEGIVLLDKDWLDKKEKPPLFFGPDKRPFRKLEPEDPFSFARLGGYFRLDREHYFILVEDDYIRRAWKGHEVFVACPSNEWEPEKEGDSWKMERTKVEGHPVRMLKAPSSLIETGDPFPFKFKIDDASWINVAESAPNAIPDGFGNHNLEFHPGRTGHHVFHFTLPDDCQPNGAGAVLWISEDHTEQHALPPTASFFTLETESTLGVVFEHGGTTFRLFAPRAKAVTLRCGRTTDLSDARIESLEVDENGVWEIHLPENLEGWFYVYHIDGDNIDPSRHFDPEFPVVDPYAKAMVSRSGPAVVVAPERVAPDSSVKPLKGRKLTDLVILEIHPRDLLARAPLPMSGEERLTFDGLTRFLREEGNYLQSLGINAIELQPVQEFDNQSPGEYHWGYMPVNWFSPESSYGNDPEKASQIEAFREFIRTAHGLGFAVLLDVVYNHVGEPNHLLFIDKLYYFETDTHHNLMNYSGCGNDFRASTPMGRRLIIDSLKHWIETFGVDGFRFDLAELLGEETLFQIEASLREIHPGVLLIAEPWSFRGHLGDSLQKSSWCCWNDGYRDFMAEYLHGEGNAETAKHFLGGSIGGLAAAPRHSLNYTESHDDRTWLDRITENENHDGTDPSSRDRRRTHLMVAMLMASLGVPMLAGGQDFLRSKGGVNNTYQRGDLNAFDYHRLAYFSGSHQYFRDWIRFRLSPAGAAFRLETTPSESFFKWFTVENKSAIAGIYNADQFIDGPRLLFVINPHPEIVALTLGDTNVENLCQIADTERFSEQGLKGGLYEWKDNQVLLPGLCCGLWRED